MAITSLPVEGDGSGEEGGGIVAEINITPLTDIFLVLLIIFMVRSTRMMSSSGETGFDIVASSLSEALIATAAGLGVAIVALTLFNYLNTRVAQVSATYARAAERLVQALLYVESSTQREGA